MTPDAVRIYYQRNGRGLASWSNGIVQAWFTEFTSNHTESGSTPSTPQPGSSKNQLGTSAPQSGSSTPQVGLTGLSRSSENNIGAIAGGTVSGAAALSFVALLGYFFLRRHRRRGRLAVPPSDTEYRKPELESNGIISIPRVIYPLSEMQGIKDPIKMPGVSYPRAEMPGSNIFQLRC